MAANAFTGPLELISPCCWRIPKSYKPGMRVDGIIFADDALIEQIRGDQAPEQVANVAFLPGIQIASFAMPDIHWGYGFCIGGLCATDPNEGGVISPGGVGYDINCGVRLIRTDLDYDEVKPHLRELVNQLFRDVPSGVGRGGQFKLDRGELTAVMQQGPRWFVERRDLGVADDIEFTEGSGCLDGADPGFVSHRAFARGADQCGTLGSGNHFLEVQVVDRIEDPIAAECMGIRAGQVCIMIHSGSRGLGHQVCTDYLARFRDLPQKYGIELPDRQLVCAPSETSDGAAYIAAMRAAANYAWANRHLLMVLARESFSRVFGRPWSALGMHLVYDVAHNIAKFEEHDVDGQRKRLWVHRKGATRAFPPGHAEVPARYRDIGQPVMIPGSMGTASWLLVGQPGSMERTFGTTCHGAGRRMSRGALSRTRKELAEEQPKAYKDVDLVVDVVHKAGLSKKVARLRSIGVIKG